MKKYIILLLFLSGCSFNTDSAYWQDNTNYDYEDILYDKDYTLEEYKKNLEMYNKKNKIPDLN